MYLWTNSWWTPTGEGGELIVCPVPDRIHRWIRWSPHCQVHPPEYRRRAAAITCREPQRWGFQWGPPPHACQFFAWVLATFWDLVGEGEQRGRASSGHRMAFGHKGWPWEAGPTPAVEKNAEFFRRQAFDLLQVTPPAELCVLPEYAAPKQSGPPHATDFPLSQMWLMC